MAESPPNTLMKLGFHYPISMCVFDSLERFQRCAAMFISGVTETSHPALRAGLQPLQEPRPTVTLTRLLQRAGLQPLQEPRHTRHCDKASPEGRTTATAVVDMYQKHHTQQLINATGSSDIGFSSSASCGHVPETSSFFYAAANATGSSDIGISSDELDSSKHYNIMSLVMEDLYPCDQVQIIINILSRMW